MLAAAVAVNVVHNLLPAFFFVLPLVIVGLMLIAPGVVGMTVGENVSKGVLGSKCRVPGQAGFIAFLSTVGGLVLFVMIARLPHCSMFDNFISVEVWSCTCDSKSILELVGHGVELPEEDGDEPTIQDPVRIFSRPLTPEQFSQIKA